MNDEEVKAYAVNEQHENWEDGGGAHDPFIIMLADNEYKILKEINLLVEDSDEHKMFENASKRPVPSFPVTVHDVFAIWTKD